ncbi:Hypothetical predicted protein [Cloeon dipterum]|uniref:Uncharacterized protein n=1 Tax=Cloeon dipterum TaxID=197152 RepID=A0A8S1DTA2_9INSE|nr:Hypothetical predicted protein [Cloeon dipterum]
MLALPLQQTLNRLSPLTLSQRQRSSSQPVRDKTRSAAQQYLCSFLHCKTSPTEAENEDSAQMTSNKRCVYCRSMFNDNHGVTPFNQTEAELVTKMCACHHNMGWTRIVHSDPQNPAQICANCTMSLRFYMQICILTKKDYSNLFW